MLSRICQSQRDKYCYGSTYKISKVVKIKKTENTMMVARPWGERQIGSCLMGIEFQFCKMEKS